MVHQFYTQPGWKSAKFIGVHYHYLFIQPKENKAIFLLLHGFPTGAFAYHSFVPLLAEKGYGILLPELKGYGKTDKPTDVKDLAYKTQSDELAKLLDAEEINKVIVVGHDFGGALAPRFTQYYPDRSLGLVVASIPYAPPSPKGLDPDALIAKLKPIIGYENAGHIKYFAHEHTAKELSEHLETFVSILYGEPARWKTALTPNNALAEHIKQHHRSYESWLSKEDHHEIVRFLKENGLEGPALWFRAAISDVNVEAEKTISAKLTLPYLSIAPTHEPTYPPVILQAQKPYAENFTIHHPDTGHWPFEQVPEELVGVIDEWAQKQGIATKKEEETVDVVEVKE
jgi:pimeloyl-ACP methyl ester carboxylesterase